MRNSKHCVVLGGTGFVGREIVNQLSARGYSITIPTRNCEQAQELYVNPQVKLAAADVHNQESLASVIGDAGVVINLVGILNEEGHHRGRGFYVAHRDLTKTVIDVCQQLAVPRLLQMSALKASSKNGPSDYLKSKGEAEDAIRAIGKGLPGWTIFQPSVIFGPDDGFMNRFAGLLKIAPFMPLARPNARFAPVYVNDVAAAFVAALDNPDTIGKTYQIGGPKVYSLRELVAYVRQLLGLKRPIIGLPDALARLQARIFGMVPGKPFSMDNFRSLTVHSICDTDGLAELGIDATPLEVIAPTYLTRGGRNAHFDQLRKSAGR
ncbi:MAG: complex I NDUFA9 subunit family protein [Pseudomonadota bacterium]